MHNTSLELIDSSVFLGMHSTNENIRIACKNYFVERLETKICMTLEHIGGCDNIIWLYPRELQDAYYPFMDTLHTVMNINRLPYEENEVKIAFNDPQLQGLSMYNKLLIALAKSRNKVVYSVNQQLLNQEKLQVLEPKLSQEKSFPDLLDKLYQTSLQLRIPDNHLLGILQEN